MSTDDVRSDLGTVFYALTCLGPRFQLVGKYEATSDLYSPHDIVASYIAQFRKRLAQPSIS